MDKIPAHIQVLDAALNVVHSDISWKYTLTHRDSGPAEYRGSVVFPTSDILGYLLHIRVPNTEPRVYRVEGFSWVPGLSFTDVMAVALGDEAQRIALGVIEARNVN